MSEKYVLKEDTNPTKDGDVVEAGTELEIQKLDFGTLEDAQKKTRVIVQEEGLELEAGQMPTEVIRDIIQECVLEPDEFKQDKYTRRLSYSDMNGLLSRIQEISGIGEDVKKK